MQVEVRSDKRIKREFYDRFCRDKEIKKFYQSAAWRHLRDLKLACDPLCQACKQAGRTVVADLPHHLLKITTPEGWEHRLDIAFLISVCHPCHNQIETEMEKDAHKRTGNQ
jgi:5-methylcytosine-specific restriction protein A